MLTASDGVRLAWMAGGQGRPLVKASNWLTHLRYDIDSPVWRHWVRFLSGRFRYVRYDERGCGLSDWDVGPDLSLARWVEDLETVVEAAGLNQPFVLLGISQGAGTAVAYAARHPERVSHLILYGGYALGARLRGNAESAQLHELMEQLAELGWDKPNPAFRRVFTSRFIPEGTEEQIEWFNELCRTTTRAEIGARLIAARARMDARQFLPRVTTPTLVLHAAGDEVVPLSEGQRLAEHIAGAEFVLLPSRNHILLEQEPAWAQFREAVCDFIGRTASHVPGRSAVEHLSLRERQALALLCEGISNTQIAWELGISEKTVRNCLSRLYEKLGVHSRAAAIVQAQRLGIRR
jgi:pimeloyl-ACP methyl ester carboxylesterase/DNA-binding CsgD family transcriptional regulator